MLATGFSATGAGGDTEAGCSWLFGIDLTEAGVGDDDIGTELSFIAFTWDDNICNSTCDHEINKTET